MRRAGQRGASKIGLDMVMLRRGSLCASRAKAGKNFRVSHHPQTRHLARETIDNDHTQSLYTTSWARRRFGAMARLRSPSLFTR
jgi:hypothetical protein